MSTRVHGRNTPDPDSASDLGCRWPMCVSLVTHRFRAVGLHFCQDHALLAWSTVQDMLYSGDVVKPKAEPRYAEDYDGWVYYIRIGERVKIGHTMEPDQRLATYPPNMEVLLLRHGSRKLERQEHRRFGEHLTDGREWFEANERVLELIAETAATVPFEQREFADDEKYYRRKAREPQIVARRKLTG